MRVIYRLAAPGDQDFLWEMLYQAVYVPPGEPAPGRDILRLPEIACYAENWGQPGDLGLLAAAEDGQPLGAAWLRLLTGEKRGYGYVADEYPELCMALLPDFRGQGIGEPLLRHLLDLAKARWRGVSLSVQRPNPAERLYRRLGFVELEQHGDSITMLLRFPRTS